MSAVNVTFPGGLSEVGTIADLRAVPTPPVNSGLWATLSPAGLWIFDPSSTAKDDGNATLLPGDLSPLQAGRWVKTGFPGPQGYKGADGLKGDTGGNVMSIGLFSQAATLGIPVGADLVQTSGYSATGIGAARYAASSDTTSPASATRFQSANGRWFDLAEPVLTLPMVGGDLGKAVTYARAKGGSVGPEYHYNFLEWSGAAGDGDDSGAGSDNTAAVQKCLNDMAAIGGGTVFVPPGHYCVKGALTSPGGANAQVALPDSSGGGSGAARATTRLLGANRPGSYKVDPRMATIFHSTLTGGNGAMFGAYPSNANTNGVLSSLYLENLIFRAPQNPTNMMVDAYWIPVFDMKACRVDTAYLENGFTLPTSKIPAIRGPRNNVPLWNNYDDLVVVGFYYAMQPGELAYVTNYNPSQCVWAAHIAEDLHHPVMFNRVVATNLNGGIKVDGHCELRIGMWDTEHQTPPSWNYAPWDGNAGDGNTGTGTPFTWDIYDPNGYSRGFAHIHVHDIPSATVLAPNLRWEQVLGWEQGSPQFEPFPGFLGGTTVNSVLELPAGRNVAGYHSDVLNVAAPPAGGIATAWVASNLSNGNGNSDYRIGQMHFYYDGGPGKAGISFATSDGTSLKTRMLIGANGNFVVNGLRQAASDAAAAALSPPVPVNGLYLNGSAMMVRQS